MNNLPHPVSSPHLHGARSVPWIMRQVLYALIPAITVYVYLFGCGILVQLMIAITTALVLESIALLLRGYPLKAYLSDGSVIVLACLLTLAIPPYTPWWVIVVGVAFAVLIGKHAFGGLGYNIFNPAMVGYLFLMLCYPVALSRWPEMSKIADYPGLWESVRMIATHSTGLPDGISGATVLSHIKTQLALMHTHSEMESAVNFGMLAGHGWEWINVAYLCGGVWLLWRRVVTWRLPLSFMVGVAFAALLGHVVDAELHRGAVFHLFAGGTMLAAFFVVTDPVSSATTPVGMLLFGFSAGLLTYCVREFGGYPDGVAVAIVIMNALAPLIDRFTQPRVYGKTSNNKHS